MKEFPVKYFHLSRSRKAVVREQQIWWGLASSRTGKAGKRGNLPAQTLRPNPWSAAGSLGPLWAQLMPGTPTKILRKRRKRHEKTSFVSILAIAMLLSLLPTTVFAIENSAATVNGTSYQLLGSAFEAASNGSTITLSADVTQSEAITVNRNVTLDLHGNTLTMSKAFKVQDGATLTITDSTNTGQVIRTGSGGFVQR